MNNGLVINQPKRIRNHLVILSSKSFSWRLLYPKWLTVQYTYYRDNPSRPAWG